jgi:hypothetical protein
VTCRWRMRWCRNCSSQVHWSVKVRRACDGYSPAYFVFPVCRGRPWRGLLGWKAEHYDGVGRTTVSLCGGRSGGDCVPIIWMLVERRTTARQVHLRHINSYEKKCARKISKN